MVAKEFLDYLGQFKFVHAAGIYDIFDRCIYILTFSIILVCSLTVTVKSYILEPMSCYVATSVEGANNLGYINNFCWITGTVARTIHHGSTDNDAYWKDMKSNKIHYYQWVPLILGIQAALIYLPYLFWECLIYNSLGTNLQFIVDMARKASLDLGQSRQNKVGRASKHVYTLLASRVKKSPYFLLPCFRRKFEIVSFYVLLKIASIAVIGLQFILMERFLNMNGEHRFFGVTLLREIIAGHHWTRTGMFPRLGFCRVQFKWQQSPEVHVLAQCSLSMNMLNEKIFLFLWWWFSVMVTLQIIALFLWLKRCLWAQSRNDFITKVLVVNNTSDRCSDDLVRHFVKDFLSADGCFLMHMTRLNCGDLVCNELIQALIDTYKADESMHTVTKVTDKSIFV